MGLVATGPVVPADHSGPGRRASHTSPQGSLTAPLGIDGAPFSPTPRGDSYSMFLVLLLLILLPALSDGPPRAQLLVEAQQPLRTFLLPPRVPGLSGDVCTCQGC